MSRLRLSLLFVTLLPPLAAAGGAGSATRSFPADAQRLLVLSEETIGPTRIRLLDERGRTRGRLFLLGGVNAEAVVSRLGTAFAYTSPLKIEVPPGVPERLRRRLRQLPETSLEFGSFFEAFDRSGGSFAFVVGIGRTRPGPRGRPAWSPDGERLAVARPHGGRLHLDLLDVDGHGALIRRLTRGRGSDLNPRWSPRGGVIAFERKRGASTDLYSIRADGTGLRMLTDWRGHETFPDWSPNGRWIVFSADVSGSYQLYVMPAAGGEVRRLTRGFWNDRRPAWSPDGRWIAFSSDRDGDNDVYLVDPSGRHTRKLTFNASEDLVQDWQPLRDVGRPVVRALPTSYRSRQAIRLRFTVSDGSPRVLVRAEMTLGDNASFGVRPQLVRARRGVVQTLHAALHDDLFGEELAAPTRFCVSATDAWGNISRTSCARLRQAG